jgi:hypothetical protein
MAAGRPSFARVQFLRTDPMNPATRRKNAPAQKQSRPERERATLLLPADVSLRLTVLAHLRGLDRSTLASELIGEATRHVVVALRGQSTSPSSAAPTGDVNLAGAVPA